MSIEGQPSYELKEIINKIQPLDLLFLKGTDFVNIAVKVGEDPTFDNDEFSHVALIINSELCPDIPHLIPDRLYAWQSVKMKDRTLGIQIRDLEEIVIAYGGEDTIAWGSLRNNPWSHLPEVKGIIVVQDDMIRLNKQRTPIITAMKFIYQMYWHRANKRRLCCSTVQSICDLYLEMIMLSPNLVKGINLMASDDMGGEPVGIHSMDIIEQMYSRLGLTKDFNILQLLQRCSSVMYIRTDELHSHPKFN